MWERRRITQGRGAETGEVFISKTPNPLTTTDNALLPHLAPLLSPSLPANGDRHFLPDYPSGPPPPLPEYCIGLRLCICPPLLPCSGGAAGPGPGVGAAGSRLLGGARGAGGGGGAEALRREHPPDCHQRRAPRHVCRARHRRAGRGNASVPSAVVLSFLSFFLVLVFPTRFFPHE